MVDEAEKRGHVRWTDFDRAVDSAKNKGMRVEIVASDHVIAPDTPSQRRVLTHVRLVKGKSVIANRTISHGDLNIAARGILEHLT